MVTSIANASAACGGQIVLPSPSMVPQANLTETVAAGQRSRLKGFRAIGKRLRPNWAVAALIRAKSLLSGMAQKLIGARRTKNFGQFQLRYDGFGPLPGLGVAVDNGSFANP
jgi:hypothetical protein